MAKLFLQDEVPTKYGGSYRLKYRGKSSLIPFLCMSGYVGMWILVVKKFYKQLSVPTTQS